MLRKTRGLLLNAFSSDSPDAYLAKQQELVDASAPVFEKWAQDVSAVHDRAVDVSEADGMVYESAVASGLVGELRTLLEEKGTRFKLDRNLESILFPKGAEKPEVSLLTVNEIAEGLDQAALRFEAAGGATEEQEQALRKARDSFDALLGHIGHVVEKGAATLDLPAIAGTDDSESLTARARHALYGDLNYTLRSHGTFVHGVRSRAGLVNRNSQGPGSQVGHDAEHTAA
ncbi:MAG: hypothetical protein KDI90_01560 [Alphaproteobacteria bacterium]|nr:hypothetical protein [Alphaproteobacteria bacterium]MCB9975263.1 hypothetical protein [Rhodospirillales bacterium]